MSFARNSKKSVRQNIPICLNLLLIHNNLNLAFNLKVKALSLLPILINNTIFDKVNFSAKLQQ